VKDGLGEVKSMGLETKAMIAAVVYGLERMMSQSAQMGTGLMNFAALTGNSAQALQKWQYAFRQVGGTAAEMEGNFKSVQATMTKMLLGQGAPSGFAMVANKVGLDPKRVRDTEYVLGQLQKFSQQVPQDVGNEMLKSFGLSEGVIAGMRRNAFRPDVFAKAPRYSDNEIKSLDKVNAAWSNLGQKIQMAFGHLTAQKGLSIVNEISKMTTEVIKLVAALTQLAEKLKVFQVLGKAFELLGMGTQLATQTVSEMTGGGSKNTAGKSKVGGLIDWRNEMDQKLGDFFKSLVSPSATEGVKKDRTPQNVNVQQTLNFQHDGKDHKKTSDSVHKAVKDAYRQMSAQAQGS
jgi:hypothetical protein